MRPFGQLPCVRGYGGLATVLARLGAIWRKLNFSHVYLLQAAMHFLGGFFSTALDPPSLITLMSRGNTPQGRRKTYRHAVSTTLGGQSKEKGSSVSIADGMACGAKRGCITS